ncbi:3-deoxy-7-phosphoheptulonate synthase [Humibacter ginsenosidimutans]|uniref:Phospho-2-dehydro-3-deoxyheptonate aldolase n=1 Tax=Humibacter ginsenosidimutans TaxID=2599293 RepID=A0A5B8M2A5_9MICO|nr:3-deoxy-7-phosphoheptulonate synthase [Humibacter ginsenosidimutans]QDZ14493.1 3-deoxy-7-phosphoheptulonate synthase [Humibacter ginsenosidimutans]
MSITAQNSRRTGDAVPNADTVSNTRVTSIQALPTPAQVRAELPLNERAAALVARSRAEVEAVLRGDDPRLLVVVGPCSVHDPDAALEYARRLAAVADLHRDRLLIVMRVYFEKPRSTGGWKGLINDPHLDGTHRVADGLRMARRLLIDILELGLPVGCEFLEPTSPQYIADAVSWGAIGARTTESQIHRQLASGLSMPIGFKNATDGDVQVAVDGCTVAGQRHVFFGVTDEGAAALVSTSGNEAAHVILRGGRGTTNYDSASVADAAALLTRAGLASHLVVDASHGNSGKSHVRQASVLRELADQVREGDPIAGVMAESFLVPGNQPLTDAGRSALAYGQSITDACIGWDETAALLDELALAVQDRREKGSVVPDQLQV